MTVNSIFGVAAFILVSAVVLLAPSSSDAQVNIDEVSLAPCMSITRKEQLVLERRAIGGDQRAQFIIAYCSWKREVDNTQREKQIAYTYFWVTLASCERRFDDLNASIEALENTNIPSVYTRHRKARDLRREYDALLIQEAAELQRIKAEVEDSISSEPLDLIASPFDLRQSVSQKLVGAFNGMGKSGLVPLAMMRNCMAYPGFQQRYVRAGLWEQIANEAEIAFWINEEDAAPSLRELALQATRDLGQDERREVDRFTQAYAIGDAGSQEWQESAALGKMGQVPVEAIQFALGAFRKSAQFSKGITIGEDLKVDGIYGAQTASLIKDAQVNPCVIRDVSVFEGTFKYRAPTSEESPNRDCFGTAHPKDEGTGWLTPRQSRALICRAAVNRNDPFSYMHLGYMFINGFGYAEDIDRALFSVQRAIQLFSDPSIKLLSVRSPSYPSESALLNYYRSIAINLEQAIYWAAAEKFFGTIRPDANSQITPELKESIHRRLPRANYDGEGMLCRDQRTSYYQNQQVAANNTYPSEEFATLTRLNTPSHSYGDLPQVSFPLSINATVSSPGIRVTPDTALSVGNE